jgi:hypothetical protein
MDTTKQPPGDITLSEEQKKYINDVCDRFAFNIPRYRRFQPEFGLNLIKFFGYNKELNQNDRHQRGIKFIENFYYSYFYEAEQNEFAYKHEITPKDITFIEEVLNDYDSRPLIRENIEIDPEEAIFNIDNEYGAQEDNF